MLKFYRSSIIFAVLAVAAGYALAGVTGAWVVLVLGSLETSLSFDNAVVNASILKNWSQKWRDRFVTYGMPVAVFGMRFAFPVAIVAVAAKLGPLDAINLAIHEPLKYAAIMTSVHLQIAAFGGAFLLMIFLKYFLDANKEVHWIRFIEEPMSHLGEMEAIVTLVVIWDASTYVGAETQLSFMMAGVWGLVTYMAVDVLGGLVNGDDSEQVGGRIIKEGVVGLLYLELIDASCSFDGVLSGFSITTNIFLLMLGLGVGAFFVRSMTLQLVSTGTLATYRYLEHSAFWAIGALASTMFISVVYELPDAVTGFIGIFLLSCGLISSIITNKRTPVEDSSAT